MRNVLFLVLFAVLGCPKQPTPTVAPESETTIPFDASISKGTLDNGLTWFVKANEEPKGWGEFWLFVKVGALQEDDDQRGLAHLLEHMAFNGTEHFPGQELIAAIESTGAKFGPHLNAHTNWHETIYKVHLPTDNPEHIDKAMLILKDWANGMLLEDEEIDKERGVVLDEWRRRLGVGERLSKEVRPALYGQRYTNRWTIGTESSLRTFKTDAVRRFYRDWYRPELMAVAAVGDFDTTAVAAKIKEAFSPLDNPKDPRPLVKYEPEMQDGLQVFVQQDDELTRSSIQWTSHIPWAWSNQKSDYRDRLIERLFYSITNQRLRAVAESPTPPYQGATVSRGSLSAQTSSMTLSVRPNVGDVLNGFHAALTEVHRIQSHGFTDAELKRERDRMQRRMENLVTEQDKTPSRQHVEELKRHFVSGETVPGINAEFALTTELLPTISLDELDAFAKQWMNDSQQVLIARLAAGTQSQPVTQDTLQQTLDAVASSEVEPYSERSLPDTLMSPPANSVPLKSARTLDGIDATEWVLPNGMRIVVKQTGFKEDEVAFRFSSWGGHSLASQTDYPSATMAVTTALQSGLASFNSTELSRMLTGKTVSVRPFIGETRQGISGSFSPKDAETAFQLIYLTLTEPRFDADRLNTFLSQRKAALSTRNAAPGTRFSDHKRKVVYQNHPRRVPWDAAMYDAVDIDTAEAFYNARFASRGDMTAVFVGNIDLKRLQALVEQYLAPLADEAAPSTWKDVGAPRRTGVHIETFAAGKEDKARVELTFHGPFSKNPANDFIRGQFVQALRKKLRLSLREENSGTYGVGVSSGSYWVPHEEYRLSISFTCASARAEELTELMWIELNAIKAEALSEAFVADLQNAARKDREKQLRTNGFWAAGLDRRLRYGEPLEDILEHDRYIEALTAQQIQSMAQKLVNETQYTQFTWVPEKE